MDKKSEGFTLVELVVVIAIMGILAVVAIPRLAGFRNKAEESVCAANRKTVERMYSAYLIENDMDHSDSIFNQFLIDNFDEICPSGGVITYKDGKVKCNVHVDEEESPEEGSPKEEVPWI
ncbi:type II secretion system protein [Clostridiisalibacter paucivorans]|uniref:type II secretion system protein n=1 Tax=Clostridiisalibacter paucivorans TaxID=408753 RepID=UPI000688FF15|nr:prepilin-type N-terminal cleavage/methylation domain-containing protein [Clostridiisalibacter paucivorans]